MTTLDQSRREFLKLLASLPVVYMVGCDTGTAPPAGKVELLSPEESVRKLIHLLGPWKDRTEADDFVRRFLAVEESIAPYIPDGGKSLQYLASRFPDAELPAEKIDLHALPEAERNLLLELSKQLYTFIEVRFLVSGEPPWGVCGADDPLRYTRAPS